jgi:rhomboid protease GluP
MLFEFELPCYNVVYRTTMVVYGAKEAALIVYEKEWWRLLSTIMLHAGIYHIIPNVLIQVYLIHGTLLIFSFAEFFLLVQARVGGYLNAIYGTRKFLLIYFASGVFGALQR